MHENSNRQLDRIQAHTAPHINDRIRRETESSVMYYSSQGREAIIRRIQELNREYDVDRAAMVNFALIGGTALAAGYFKKKSWLRLLGIQMGFLFMHATYGWCPPVPVLRRLGFRTHSEIEQERRGLEKLLETEAFTERRL